MESKEPQDAELRDRVKMFLTKDMAMRNFRTVEQRIGDLAAFVQQEIARAQKEKP